MQPPNFQKRKKQQFSKKDKSIENGIDKDIRKLCNKINSSKNYYTTSSCSGRIVLIIDSEKKQENLFLFRTHNKTSFREIKKELEKIKMKKLIYFKQEPVILHAACSSLENAQKLIDDAKLAGWKSSGIISSRRFVCELRSTEKLELPIENKGKVLISDSYLKLLVKEANKKLARTRKKIKNLEKLI